jgi:lipoprotein signal peptidase
MRVGHEDPWIRVPDFLDIVALRVTTLVFFAAFAADLVSKQWAVEHADRVIFNHTPTELPFRLLMSLVAVAVGLVIARLALRRGLGRQWGVWIGCALLVAGILANGISPLLWDRGVPDFIDLHGGWSWNVADFEIAIGLVGGILSVAFSAVAVYARERVARER